MAAGPSWVWKTAVTFEYIWYISKKGGSATACLF